MQTLAEEDAWGLSPLPRLLLFGHVFPVTTGVRWGGGRDRVSLAGWHVTVRTPLSGKAAAGPGLYSWGSCWCPLRLSGWIPAVVLEGSEGSPRGWGSSNQEVCGPPSVWWEEAPLHDQTLRRTGQMAFMLSSRPRTSAWHEHTVCLPEAAEARRESAPRGRGYVRTSVCERVRRAGVGGREATGPQNHSCDVGSPRWPSTTTEGGCGVWLLNTAGLPRLREGSHMWKSPFLPNTGARREGPRREAPLSQHLIPWGNLTSQSLHGLPPSWGANVE